jgi:hypothetical protein
MDGMRGKNVIVVKIAEQRDGKSVELLRPARQRNFLADYDREIRVHHERVSAQRYHARSRG